MRPAITAIAAALALAACGSGSSSSSSRAGRAAASGGAANTTGSANNAATASASKAATGNGAATTTGPVRATLRAPNHDPVVKRKWPYWVVVRGANSRPLAGSVEIQFVYGGQVVGRDTPPTHRLTHGRWHDKLQFPAAAVGVPLTFQVVVRTSEGTVTLNWPVKVKQ